MAAAPSTAIPYHSDRNHKGDFTTAAKIPGYFFPFTYRLTSCWFILVQENFTITSCYKDCAIKRIKQILIFLR